MLKQRLLEECKAYVATRIDTARQSMEDAQRSANEESKSSAGDKYETGRAMMQIERDKAAQQLEEALKLKSVLDQLPIERVPDKIGLGSLVITPGKKIFISIGIGRLRVDNEEYLVVAPTSPLGKTLMGLKEKDQTTFQREVITIKQVV